MRMYDIISKKKNKLVLSKEEIDFFINGIVDLSIPNYQTTALLMAILLNGMNDEEIFYLTNAMVNSGEVVDLSKINGITCDKHSTGGVGDSTTFVVAPILASLGLKTAKMSGRALGHTGGTLDKLESIGVNVELSSEEFYNQVNNIGLSIIGQTANICPADKILYSLRDVTATVDSIPLIASSIMSKKIAGGSDIIVLDVKCGSGAFIKNILDAENLATKMVNIGKKFNKKISAIITDMNEPLDNYIGNSLEILGAVNVLMGEKNDLYKVSKALSHEIIKLSNIISEDKIDSKIDEVISSGLALEKFKQMILAQNGDISYINNKSKLINTNFKYDIIANKTGYISAFNTEKIGNIMSQIGAGRETISDKIDHFVGIKLDVKIGDYIKKGDIIGKIYINKNIDISTQINDCMAISIDKVPKMQKIIKKKACFCAFCTIKHAQFVHNHQYFTIDLRKI